MYQLLVFYPNDTAARHSHSTQGSGEALDQMRALLAAHPECSRIEIFHDQTKLFAVDCAGNRLL